MVTWCYTVVHTSKMVKFFTVTVHHLGLQYEYHIIHINCCVMQISYIDNYSVFSVSTAMIAYTKEQCSTPTYFPYFLTYLPKIGEPGSSNFWWTHRLLISTVNSLLQLSVSSTPALCQTHKRPTCKAACMRQEEILTTVMMQKCVQWSKVDSREQESAEDS